jgi:hypothetical protein
MLKVEEEKFRTVAAVYSSQRNLVFDASEQTRLQDAANKCNNIANNIQELASDPKALLDIFKLVSSRTDPKWEAVKSSVDAFNEMTLGFLMSAGSTALGVASMALPITGVAAKVAAAIVPDLLRVTGILTNQSILEAVLKDEVQEVTGIKVVNNEGGFSAVKVGTELIVGVDVGLADSNYLLDAGEAGLTSITVIGNGQSNTINVSASGVQRVSVAALQGNDFISVLSGVGDAADIVTVDVGTGFNTAQLFHLRRRGSSFRVAIQPALASFQKLLRPAVVQALGNALTPAQFSDAVFTPQAIQNDPDLLFS